MRIILPVSCSRYLCFFGVTRHKYFLAKDELHASHTEHDPLKNALSL